MPAIGPADSGQARGRTLYRRDRIDLSLVSNLGVAEGPFEDAA